MTVVNNRLTITSIVLFASLTALIAGDKEPHFTAGQASSYPTKQTSEKVTIAAVSYVNEDLVRQAFGKVDPNRYGFLPLLIVIQNDSSETLRLDNMRVEFVTSDRSHLDATPAKDVPYLGGARQPKMTPAPIPGGGSRVKRVKNPLANGEIDIRAFSARMLPPGDQASGFFYFRTPNQYGATAYLTGIKEAGTGKELLYFEIPLSLSQSGTQ